MVSNEQLNETAGRIRRDILISLTEAGSGHAGGSLGLTDIFTCLYFSELNHNPAIPQWENRDRLILSIGHVAPVLYATLAHAGYFDRSELLTLRKFGSRLQGHPGREHGLPGLELSAGSLGQGLSVSVGLTLGARLKNQSWRTFCILGDGELQEGSVWEAAMAAGHHSLNNLIAIVDRNGLQIDGQTEKVMKLEPLAAKWDAFNWNVIECNGNDIGSVLDAFRKAGTEKIRPTVIIANTIMGFGVKSIEGNYLWHGKAPSQQELPLFLTELDQFYKTHGNRL